MSQTASGLEKRQATLQLCIRSSGEQTIKPAIVFRGKGNMALDELTKYDKRVDIYFQDKGWMDIKTNKEWTERTLMPGILDTRKESMLFADNVSFQTEKEFHKISRKSRHHCLSIATESNRESTTDRCRSQMDNEKENWRRNGKMVRNCRQHRQLARQDLCKGAANFDDKLDRSGMGRATEVHKFSEKIFQTHWLFDDY